MQSRPTFALAADECELLVLLEQRGSLAEVARAFRKDLSVISRRLAAIARKAPVLEKHGGRWKLTAAGVQLNRWTVDAISGQRRVLRQQHSLRIGATREFAARVLVPGWLSLFPEEDEVVVTLRTYEDGIENAILVGEVDLGFDCGRPNDPAIAFTFGAREPFSVVASRTFLRRHRASRFQELTRLPHVLYGRAAPTLAKEPSSVRLVVNDIACAREAVVHGLGWAILPTYCVRAELDAGVLVTVPGPAVADERFGVWVLREHEASRAWVARAIAWLKSRRLE